MSSSAVGVESMQLLLNLGLVPPPRSTNLTHIICFSGGVASALVAIEVVRKYGPDNVILVNHDISSWTEDPDVKAFKQQVADYLGLSITWVNIDGIKDADKIPDQFDVCVKAKAFKVGKGTELCSNRLKTQPFYDWLPSRYPSGSCILYYGFGSDEQQRIDRRSQIVKAAGYQIEFPLAHWERTIQSTEEIGIKIPTCYEMRSHANCWGCLKGGRQHWYVTYCHRRDVFDKAKWAERKIGYTILKECSLAKLEPLFEAMIEAGIPQTEQIQSARFWADVRRELGEVYYKLRPEVKDGKRE